MDFSFLFSRFCWFYGWTDTHVLAMPARRFWMMERQISRIQAENNLRTMTLHSTVNPPQSSESGQRVEEYIGRLTLEIGETAKLRRNIFVAPEPSAKQKFLNLIGNR